MIGENLNDLFAVCNGRTRAEFHSGRGSVRRVSARASSPSHSRILDVLVSVQRESGVQVRVEGQLVFNSTYQMLDAAAEDSAWPICRRISRRSTYAPDGWSGCLRAAIQSMLDITFTTRAAVGRQRLFR
jgi:hypothetical protein